MQKALILAIFWIENLTVFGADDLFFALPQEFEKWNFARAIEKLGLDIENVNRKESLLQVFSEFNVFIHNFTLRGVDVKSHFDVVFVNVPILVVSPARSRFQQKVRCSWLEERPAVLVSFRL